MDKINPIKWKFVFTALLVVLITILATFIFLYVLSWNIPITTTIVCSLLFLVKAKSNNGKLSKVDIGILFVLISFIISTIHSIEPHRSWVYTVEISRYLMVILFSQLIIQRWVTISHLSITLLLLGIAYQISLTKELANWFIQWRMLFPEYTFPPTTFRFENGNGNAIVLLFIFFLQLGLLYTLKKKILHILLSGGLVWTLVLFYFCSSRGGTLALGTAGLVFAGLEYKKIIQPFRPIYQKYFTNRWLTVLVLLILVPAIIFGGIGIFNAINAHPSHGALDLGNRMPYWRPAMKSFLESPVIGNGFLTQTFFFLAENSVPPDGFYFNSHNLYLDILSGNGLVGALAAGFLFLAISSGLLRAKRNTPGDETMLVIAAFPMWIGFLVHSLFASSYLSYFVSIPLCIVIGAVLANDLRTIKFSLPVREISVGLILFITWGLYFVQQPYVKAIREVSDNPWSRTSRSLDKAVSRFSISPLYNREAGYAHAEAAANGDMEELSVAIKRFEAATNLDPYYAPNYLNLGALQVAAGEINDAKTSFEKAVSLADRWDLAWLNLGYLCEISGDTACSRQAYLTTLNLSGHWINDPFWEENSLRQSVFTTIKASTSDVSPSEYDLQDILEEGYAEPATAYARKMLSAGKLDEAERLLKIAPLLYVRNENELVEIHWLEAELAAAKGEIELAAKIGAEARNEFVENKLNDSIPAGVNSTGEVIYHLPTLGIDLVPQVIWLPYPNDWMTRMEHLQSWQAIER